MVTNTRREKNQNTPCELSSTQTACHPSLSPFGCSSSTHKSSPLCLSNAPSCVSVLTPVSTLPWQSLCHTALELWQRWVAYLQGLSDSHYANIFFSPQAVWLFWDSLHQSRLILVFILSLEAVQKASNKNAKCRDNTNKHLGEETVKERSGKHLNAALEAHLQALSASSTKNKRLW